MVFEHGSALPKARGKVKERQGNSRARPGANTRSGLIGEDPFRSDGAHPPRRLGYIRVSTQHQLADRQVLLLEAECDVLHVERISGAAAERPVFDAVLAALRPGDAFVVVDLDRAFRSSIDAMLTADMLRKREIGMRILSLDIDTRTPEGELFYSLVAAFAQYERRIISRRTKEGLEAARRRGVRLGRPGALAPETIRDAHDWIAETGLPCRYVSALLGVSRLTLQRGFRRLGLSYPLG